MRRAYGLLDFDPAGLRRQAQEQFAAVAVNFMFTSLYLPAF